MTQNKDMQKEIFNKEKLLKVLTKKFDKKVIDAKYHLEELHGGTVGKVYLVSGKAKIEEDKVENFQVVLKKQHKWERYGDSLSWRREYDLYHSDLSDLFLDDFSWPKCYEAKLNDDSFELWLEYIDGPSADQLTLEMYEKAAESLGRFQGKLYREQPNQIKILRNLSSEDYVKIFYHHYKSWKEVYDYVREEENDLPKHLCQMMIDLDSREEEIFNSLDQSPLVLCHRDYWNTNIFCVNNHIYAIDWDTTGYGYFGEDMASLIADETDPGKMLDYFKICVKAYENGFSQYAKIQINLSQRIHDLILLMFGYRLIESFKFSKNQEEKNLAKNALQAIYDMKTFIK
ncbi:MAG: aminoglycoside phosphotransferase family protein [Candidatus Izemoplasmatales bacterium]